MKVLFVWLGMTDIRASKGEEKGLGPVAEGVQAGNYTKLKVLASQKSKAAESYCKWIRSKFGIEVELKIVELTSPTSFGEIYEAASGAIEEEVTRNKEVSLTYHLSPGTNAMSAVWIILAKTKYPAELIESSIEAGVKIVSLPFDISADYLPEMAIKDSEIARLTQGLPPLSPEFDNIIYKCKAMKQLIAGARRIAIHDVPVLIQGETGTGKELFARAIHSGSTRKDSKFVAVNCGAIPENLLESEFFGYKKGAFSGANKDKKGFLEEADMGTLFLDEIGELPLNAQVKLLRVLQEGKLTRLGDTKEIKVDVRIIAATNRNLAREIADERFRSDLFHRIAVGMLQLPPLRERQGDLILLAEKALQDINDEFVEKVKDWKHKKFSINTRNIILNHVWPGNVRELYNTISRAVIWTQGQTIKAEEMKDAILLIPDISSENKGLLNKPIENGIELKNIIAEVAEGYIKKALDYTHDNKTKASELLGFSNYQTLSNWMKKYGIK